MFTLSNARDKLFAIVFYACVTCFPTLLKQLVYCTRWKYCTIFNRYIVFSQGYFGALGALLVQLGAVSEPEIAFENNFVPPAWSAAITHGYPVLRQVTDDGKTQESANDPSDIDGQSSAGCDKH